MAKVCVVANLFFSLTKNDIILHYNKFPNLMVYYANFPSLKGPRVPSQIAKNPAICLSICLFICLATIYIYVCFYAAVNAGSVKFCIINVLGICFIIGESFQDYS